ncbi:MAG: AMP-binding protein [Prevotellaceae bacterium]|jgi:long-chain acyl-CoA synthetase|nr:AMP-binding protein [Prevotellaceae bacterium]
MQLPTKLTLQEILRNSAKQFGDKLALSFVSNTPVSYNKMAEMARKIGFYLHEKGIKKQDKIAILSENMPNWGVSYFSISASGNVTVPILVDFSAKEVNNILEHSDSKMLFISKKLTAKHGDALQFDGDIIYIDDFSSAKEDEDGIEEFAIKNAGTFAKYAAPEVEENDLASIIYTSGTTGRNKGVMLSNLNIVYDAVQILTVQNVTPEDSLVSVLPLAHSYECTLGFILPLMCGATIYYLEKPPTASHLLPALQQIRPTLILTVPLIIEKIFKMQIKPKLTKGFVMKLLYKVGFIRKKLFRIAGKQLMEKFGGRLIFFGIGGAPLNPEVEKFLLASGIPYAIGYGMTETSPITAAGGVGKTHLGGIGIIIDGAEMYIDNPHPKTGEGEMVVRGKMVMQGYYKDPEITREVLSEDGWLRTGDLGVIKNGILYIKGRSKNMILGASGENIYPEEIEAVINSIDAVSESLVCKANNKLIAKVVFEKETFEAAIEEYWQQDMTHYIEFNASHSWEEKTKSYLQNLKQEINEHFGKFSQIADIEVRFEPFEKTATQKIKRYLYC